jgi:hypothetical protein
MRGAQAKQAQPDECIIHDRFRYSDGRAHAHPAVVMLFGVAEGIGRRVPALQSDLVRP